MKKTWKSKLEIQKQNQAHPWRIGELCGAFYNEIGPGVIYRVINVETKTYHYMTKGETKTSLTITPVHGVVTDISNRRQRILDSAYCTPLSIVELSTEYASLGNFIRDEVQKRSTADDASESTN